jgi:hypothetical protein
MYSLSALFLFAQAAPVTVPPWVAIATPLAGALVAKVVPWTTLSITRRMQQERQAHETQEAWRAERTQAYSVFFSLARDARARSHRSSKPVAETGGQTTLEELRVAHARVELVAGKEKLVEAANKLYHVCVELLEGRAPPEADDTYRRERRAFLNWALDELGLPRRSLGS